MLHICLTLQINPPHALVVWVLYLISQLHLLRSNRGLFIPAADLISDIKDVLLASQTAEETVLSSLLYLLFWFIGNYTRYSAAREPETKAIVENLILKHDFSLSVALDGGSLLVTYPYDKPTQSGVTNCLVPLRLPLQRFMWPCAVRAFCVQPFVCGVDSL